LALIVVVAASLEEEEVGPDGRRVGEVCKSAFGAEGVGIIVSDASASLTVTVTKTVSVTVANAIVWNCVTVAAAFGPLLPSTLTIEYAGLESLALNGRAAERWMHEMMENRVTTEWGSIFESL
jgi:hypothetical protein